LQDGKVALHITLLYYVQYKPCRDSQYVQQLHAAIVLHIYKLAYFIITEPWLSRHGNSYIAKPSLLAFPLFLNF